MSLKFVRDLLAANAGVIAIVGSKIYPVQIPEGKDPPYISLHRISSIPVSALDKFAGLTQTSLSVDCWHTTYGGLLQIRDAVTSCLLSTNQVQQTELEDYDSMVRVYHVSQHWLVWT